MMSMRPAGVAALFCLGAMIGPGAAVTAPSKPEASPPGHWGVLNKYCVKCHNTEDWAGGVAFDATDAAEITDQADTWEKVVRKLRAGMMPPAGKPRPRRPVLEAFAAELASRVDQAQTTHPL